MVFIATFSHFLADFLGSIFKPLGPYFIQTYEIDAATFGSTIALISSLASLMQIGFGLFYDNVKRDGIHILILLFLIIMFLGLLGFATSFFVVTIFIFLITLLNSAYHPLGASLAGSLNRGRDVALFSVFGTFGAAAGPVFITLYTSKIGFNKLYIAAIILIVILIPIIPKISKYQKDITIRKRFPGFKALKSILPIFLVVLFRSFIMDLFHIYVPIFLEAKGESLVTGGAFLTLGLLGGMLTTFLGVMFREKIGIFRINLIGFGSMGIMGILFFFTDALFLRATFYILFDAGAFLTMSANILEAQTRMPNNRAFASSVTMGFAWSIGGFLGAGYAALFGNRVDFLIISLSIFSMCLSLLMIYFSARFGRKRRQAAS